MTTDDPPTTSHLPGLRWSLKRPFLHYISRLSDGRCSVTDGALVDGDQFYFTLIQDTAANPNPNAVARQWHFGGDVRFAGHHGLLFVQISDPWLVLEGDGGHISIDTGSGRIVLVTLTAHSTAHGYDGTDVLLTEQGSELFNQVYPEGEPFDDLAVLLTHPTISKERHDYRPPANLAH